MAVGPTHSRGVVGVMSGAGNGAHSKGLAVERRGRRKQYARHRTGKTTWTEISPHSGTGSPGAAMPVYELGSFAGRGVSGGDATTGSAGTGPVASMA